MRLLYSSLALLLVLGVSASLARVHAGGPFSGLYRPSVEVEVPVECERSPEACGGSGVHVSAMAPAQARNASRVNGIGKYVCLLRTTEPTKWSFTPVGVVLCGTVCGTQLHELCWLYNRAP